VEYSYSFIVFTMGLVSKLKLQNNKVLQKVDYKEIHANDLRVMIIFTVDKSSINVKFQY